MRLPGYALIYLIFQYLFSKLYATISIAILTILIKAVCFYLYTHTKEKIKL